MSRNLRTLPSDLLGLTDPIQRFYFDRSVWLFGSQVEADIEQATKKAKNDRARDQKRDQVLRRWIPEHKVERKFKDPAVSF